ncbi:MAG: hypothetical protein KBT02_08820 [Treponema sp.]|nr:hypothetical protein [Candidatus Treponema caballi]
MKKALVILMALAMIFSAFADEPAFAGSVTEFKGDASVTWTADFDAGKTGFSNSASADLKVELVPAGDKATAGEGIWGEIKIKTDGLQINDGAIDKGTASVDTAKIHFGDAYIGVKAGGVQVGGVTVLEAINNNKDGEEHKLGAVGTKDVSNGIVAGYANDLFGIDVDFRSKPAAAGADEFTFTPLNIDSTYVPAEKEVVFIPAFGEKTGDGKATIKKLFGNEAAALLDTGYYSAYKKVKTDGAKATDCTDEYAVAGNLSVTAVPNLTLKGGISYDLSCNKGNMGIYGAIAYDYAINDTFYLKPQAAIALEGKDEFTKNVNAALFLGWNKSEGNGGKLMGADVKFSNGFSVATDFAIADPQKLPLDITVYDAASLVSGLTFGAAFKIADLKADFAADITGKVAYDIAAGAGTITAKAEAATTAKFDKIELDSGLDFAGFVDNTTFGLGYKSGDLKSKKGSVSVTAKVAF